MKYFSLEFKVDKSDYKAYYKDFGKAILINQIKRSAITIVLMLVMLAMYMSVQTSSLLVTVVFMIIATVTMPLVYAKKLSFSLIESRNSKEANRYDFYADHIEIHVEADEKSKGSLEKHLKMNGFVSVAESKTNFYFSYMNEKMLIIPKRVLDEEKYAMIKNLIDNYFSNVYMSV